MYQGSRVIFSIFSFLLTEEEIRQKGSTSRAASSNRNHRPSSREPAYRRVGAVLINQQLSSTEYVGFIDHGFAELSACRAARPTLKQPSR